MTRRELADIPWLYAGGGFVLGMMITGLIYRIFA